MQQTLILLKPDGIHRRLIGAVIQRFEQKGLRLAGLKLEQGATAEAEEYYRRALENDRKWVASEPRNSKAKEMLAKRGAVARGQDTQAPRSLAGARATDSSQSPRTKVGEAPRGQDTQAPRGQDAQAPRGQDAQAPRGQDSQAPRSLAGARGADQAPRGQDAQAPRGQDSQAPQGVK